LHRDQVENKLGGIPPIADGLSEAEQEAAKRLSPGFLSAVRAKYGNIGSVSIDSNSSGSIPLLESHAAADDGAVQDEGHVRPEKRQRGRRVPCPHDPRHCVKEEDLKWVLFSPCVLAFFVYLYLLLCEYLVMGMKKDDYVYMCVCVFVCVCWCVHAHAFWRM
jgi:hypothetical protein